MAFLLPFTRSRSQRDMPLNNGNSSSGSSLLNNIDHRQVKQEHDIQIIENGGNSNENSSGMLSHISTTHEETANNTCTPTQFALKKNISSNDESSDSCSDDSRSSGSCQTPIKEERFQIIHQDRTEDANTTENIKPDTNLKHFVKAQPQESSYEPDTKRFCTSSTVSMSDFEDPDIVFFKSLLPDIKEMTPMQKRKFKSSVFSLINTILENE